MSFNFGKKMKKKLEEEETLNLGMKSKISDKMKKYFRFCDFEKKMVLLSFWTLYTKLHT